MELVRALGASYDALNAEHQAIVRSAVEEHGGQVVRTEGDAFFVVFSDAGEAARAAVGIQQAMATHRWPDGHDFKLRIGLHSGMATRAGDDYGGFEVSRAARIAAVGWGGQIVVSDATRALISADLPEDWDIHDLGRHRLKGIAEPEQLFQLDAPELPHDFLGVRSEAGAASHLPARPTTFIGREAELAVLGRLLGANRLLTLTGPGGTGKTSLALELARRHAAHLKDGTWLVDLQTVSDPSLVRAEIAHGIGLFDGPLGRAADRLMHYVADRSLLIVIDNFEQVLTASGDVDELLRASARSRVIVTSRVPLRLSAEQEYAVHPLGLGSEHDTGESEAVRLYVDRARRVRPDVRLDEVDLKVIGQTCRLVDGLPLAIELCAARVSALPIATIHDRLAKRLHLPGSGPRDLPERQRTVEATVAWSHDLLPPPLQEFFARLSVFEETFDYEQAEVVCGPGEAIGTDVLDGLVGLVEHSLLRRVDDEVGGVRYAMLETIRAFASARLDASGMGTELKRRHMLAYVALAEVAASHLPGPEQPRWIARLEPDDANLLAATRHAIDIGDADSALRLVASSWRYLQATGRLDESRTLIDRALRMVGADAPNRTRLWALGAAGSVAYWFGDAEHTRACYEAQLELAQELGDPEGEADAWLNLSYSRVVYDQDVEGAQQADHQARILYQSLGDNESISRLDWFRTAAIDLVNDVGAVDRLATQAMALDALDDDWHRALALTLRSRIAILAGDHVGFVRYLCGIVRVFVGLRDVANATVNVQSIVAALPTLELWHQGAVALGALDAGWERYGLRSPTSEYSVMTGAPVRRSEMEAKLGLEEFRRAVAEGRGMTFNDLADYVETALPPDLEAR